MSSFKVYGTTFKLDRKYTPIRPIGRGAYGVVCAAKNRANGEKVAIKRISPMAASVTDAKHTLREIRLLRHLGKHENVVTLKDLYANERDDELYVIMELLDTDMHRIIQSSQTLTDAHFKHFMFQLVRGVHFTHSAGVLHRDLKPSNLLVTKNCDVRISDFGLSRLAPEKGSELMTEHVVTRWYRPPELMLSADGNYDASVDIWSVGCIFAELLGRTPLFPGKNFMHQLQLIFDVIGTPPKEELEYVKSEQAIAFMKSLPYRATIPFNSLYPLANPKAIDFLEKCLKFDPKKRLSVDAALAHPYFDSVRDQYDMTEPKLPPEFEFDFEYGDLSRGELRRLIVEEVNSFRREVDAAARRKRLKELGRTDSFKSTGSAGSGSGGGGGGGKASTPSGSSSARGGGGGGGSSSGDRGRNPVAKPAPARRTHSAPRGALRRNSLTKGSSGRRPAMSARRRGSTDKGSAKGRSERRSGGGPSSSTGPKSLASDGGDSLADTVPTESPSGGSRSRADSRPAVPPPVPAGGSSPPHHKRSMSAASVPDSQPPTPPVPGPKSPSRTRAASAPSTPTKTPSRRGTSTPGRVSPIMSPTREGAEPDLFSMSPGRRAKARTGSRSARGPGSGVDGVRKGSMPVRRMTSSDGEGSDTLPDASPVKDERVPPRIVRSLSARGRRSSEPAGMGEGDYAGVSAVARVKRKSKVTVPKSPNFSKMSWERGGSRSTRTTQHRAHAARQAAVMAALPHPVRSSSATRTRKTRLN